LGFKFPWKRTSQRVTIPYGDFNRLDFSVLSLVLSGVGVSVQEGQVLSVDSSLFLLFRVGLFENAA